MTHFTLGDFYNEGPKTSTKRFLPPGNYLVCVGSYKLLTSGAGTPGVKFFLTAEDGRVTPAMFWLTEPSGGRLSSFAKACGLSRKCAGRYNVTEPDSHELLVGRIVHVEVVAENSVTVL